MTEDEQKIRYLVSLWMHASTKGDLAAVLTLMTDDVVFQTVGDDSVRGPLIENN